MQSLKEKRNRNNTYTSTDLKSMLGSPEQLQSGVPKGKRSQAACPCYRWDFKLLFWGFLLIIPGRKLISSLVCVPKCSSGLTFTFSQCCLSHLVSHRISLDPRGLAILSGAQGFQDLLSFLSKVLPDLLCLREGTESGQCPGRSEIRSEACSPASEAWTRLLPF